MRNTVQSRFIRRRRPTSLHKLEREGTQVWSLFACRHVRSSHARPSSAGMAMEKWELLRRLNFHVSSTLAALKKRDQTHKKTRCNFESSLVSGRKVVRREIRSDFFATGSVALKKECGTKGHANNEKESENEKRKTKMKSECENEQRKRK